MRAATVIAGCLASCGVAAQEAGTSGCPDGEGCPGVELGAQYLGELHDNLRGGQSTGTAWSHLARAGVLWTVQPATGVASVTSHLSVMAMEGGGISGRRVGDLQGISNIEADSGVRLYEFWTEARFGAGTTSLRGGFLDLNTEFDVPYTSVLFVSPSHGIGSEFGMSGSNGPAIWPSTGLGLRAAGQFGAGSEWRLAVFEGQPGKPDSTPFARVDLTRAEGALLIGEVSLFPDWSNKLQFGGWHYTARFQPLDPGATAGGRDNRGAYALVDLPIARRGATRLDLGLRAGKAAADYNAVGTYLGIAVTASQFADRWPADQVGLAIAHARTTSGWRATTLAGGNAPLRSETSFELSWRHALGDVFALLPHVHYVRQPGAIAGPRDAWVLGVRFEATRTHRWPALAGTTTPSPPRVAQSIHTD